MRLRSSPAQKFIVARLLRGRDKAAIRAELDRRGLVGLSGRQLDRLRHELVPPEPFLPHVSDHDPSRRFLQQVGVEAFFRHDPAVKEALVITERPRLQELVETMLLAGAEPDMIARGVELRLDMSLSPGAVEAYRTFLFDIEQLDATEVRWLMTKRLRSGGKLDPDLVRHDARATAALLPNGQAAGLLAQLRLGLLPRDIDHRRLLGQARGVLAARILERAVGGSARDAQAAAQFAAALKTVDTIVEQSIDPNENVLDMVRHLELVSDRQPLPTVTQLCGSNRTLDLQPLGGPASDDGDEELEGQADQVAAG